LPDDIALITGCVHIDGAWNGAVMLQCPQSLAERLAGELFGSDTTTSPEEVQDTVGELTNSG
jgi:CheY-specific phosphatase CheX